VRYTNYPTYYAYTFDAATWGGLVNFYVMIFETSSLLSIFTHIYLIIIQALCPYSHTFVAAACGFTDPTQFRVFTIDHQEVLDRSGGDDLESGA
jgi:hypothetical protein